jgi:hypothetical protein
MITLKEFRELTKDLPEDLVLGFSLINSYDVDRMGFNVQSLKVDLSNNRLELKTPSTDEFPDWDYDVYYDDEGNELEDEEDDLNNTEE